jgi:hypothetical protein
MENVENVEQVRQKLDELRDEYQVKIKPMIDRCEYNGAVNELSSYFAYFDTNLRIPKIASQIHSSFGFLGLLESLLIEMRRMDSADEVQKADLKDSFIEGVKWFEAYLAQTILPVRE